MAPTADLKDVGLAIIMLRSLPSPPWNQAELSRRSGVDQSQISDYELGKTRPRRKTLARLVAPVGVEVSFFEQLIPVCRGIRLAFERVLRQGQTGTPADAEIAPGLEGKIARAVQEAMAPYLLQLSRRDREPVPRAEDRAWAAERWSRLEPLPAEDQSLAVEALLGDDRGWALAERLCLASAAAAADRASEALRLARLAVRLAEQCPGPESWRLRFRGWCEPFLGNALRVGGDLTSAGRTFASADEHWQRGAAGDPAGLLDGTRRLDLKASLLMYQEEHFDEARSLLDQALRGVSDEQTRGRLLLKKATALEIAGEYEAALEVLDQAEPRIDGEREPRLFLVHRFNRLVNFLHLDRYEAAEPLVSLVETLSMDLGNELDRVRSRWLLGRCWAGLGRREEALAALSEVRRYFRTEEIAYDFALVSLEVAVLHLEQGQTRLVRDLAEEMLWIFKSQKVHNEALAALALFRRAAGKEEARAEWTRRLIKYLYRAQHNPRLRFEA